MAIVLFRNLFEFPALIAVAKTTELLIKLFARGGRTAVFDADVFPFTAELQANWEAIRKEVDKVLIDDETIPRFRQVHERYTVVEPWKTYILWGYGFRVDRNCEECPETTRLVERVPRMTTAMFSILPPGTKIPPHVGIYNGVLRYHLGLYVPEPEQCEFRIDGKVIHWREGEDFVFDNRYEHSAKNEGTRPRVVLFLDFMRPLPKLLDRMNQWVVKRVAASPTMVESKKNLDAFYAQLDQSRAAAAAGS